jgi:hypothetical protein
MSPVLAVFAVLAVLGAIASSTVRALSIRGPQATVAMAIRTMRLVRARREALLNRCMLLLL